MTTSLQQPALRLLPLALIVACQADRSTVPSSIPSSELGPSMVVTDQVVASLHTNPDSQMVFVGDRFKVVAQPRNAAGQALTKVVRWTVFKPTVARALDSLKSTMTFKALRTGITGIKATSGGVSRSVKVVVRGYAGARVVLTPAETTIVSGTRSQFVATGLTAAGETAAVNVTWTATGGVISRSGALQAGTVPGNYRVTAKSRFGAADTSNVTIAPALPPATPTAVVLLPATASLVTGSTTQFSAYGRTVAGDSVDLPVTYTATGGTVSDAGVYTAGFSTGRYQLIARSAEGAADTAEISVTMPGRGIPFGTWRLWAAPVGSPGVAAFTASTGYIAPTQLVRQIATARDKKMHLLLAMTGGSHEDLKTDGVFDESKWRAMMDAFNTPEIQAAVAEGVANGTIIGNSVVDEPQQYDRDGVSRPKSWGPKGTFTKRRVDGLCVYVKQIFATLPVGVFHSPLAFEPDSSYRVCNFLWSQYDMIKGDPVAYRDAALRITARDGMALVLGINLLDGGPQDKDGVWDCTNNSGGLGTYSPNCQMTSEQARQFGTLLGPSGCAFMAWRYDAAFMDKPENQAALSAIASTLADLSRVSCAGTRAP